MAKGKKYYQGGCQISWFTVGISSILYTLFFFRHVASRVDVLLLVLVGNMLEPGYEML